MTSACLTYLGFKELRISLCPHLILVNFAHAMAITKIALNAAALVILIMTQLA